MAFNLVYLNILKQLSKELASIVASNPDLLKGIRGLLTAKTTNRLLEVEGAMNLQMALNEKYDEQLRIIQAALENVQKSIRVLTLVSCVAAGFGAVAVVLWLVS